MMHSPHVFGTRCYSGHMAITVREGGVWWRWRWRRVWTHPNGGDVSLPCVVSSVMCCTCALHNTSSLRVCETHQTCVCFGHTLAETVCLYCNESCLCSDSRHRFRSAEVTLAPRFHRNIHSLSSLHSPA